MKRKLSVHLYVGAFVITSLIFIIGFALGSWNQEKIYSEIGNEVVFLQERMRDIELLLVTENTDYFCDLYDEKLPNLNKDSYFLWEKLEYMESERGFSDPELKKQYFELELRDFILTKKAKEKCDLDINIILYFYNNVECRDCKKQGFEITKVRSTAESENISLRLYTFDGGMNDSAVVKTLLNEFEIVEYPSTVLIKEDIEIIKGYHSNSEIYKKIKGN
ncbi:hypothetical protein KO465_00810 [Candidatus Micrarchaeota archaeon]|jgi:hypothetical protein|nr:hypothetical protein [Candidatus Micrarchaeota archaeon]